MGRYDEEITTLSDDGLTAAQIVDRTGISRATVYTVMKRLRPERVKKRVTTSSYVTVPIDPKHRKQHANDMFRALERDRAGRS
nr:hypothetical protein GCM10025732_48150 [Glycomyces mayteni]